MLLGRYNAFCNFFLYFPLCGDPLFEHVLPSKGSGKLSSSTRLRPSSRPALQRSGTVILKSLRCCLRWRCRNYAMRRFFVCWLIATRDCTSAFIRAFFVRSSSSRCEVSVPVMMDRLRSRPSSNLQLKLNPGLSLEHMLQSTVSVLSEDLRKEITSIFEKQKRMYMNEKEKVRSKWMNCLRASVQVIDEPKEAAPPDELSPPDDSFRSYLSRSDYVGTIICT
jgi:hypothetical protein